LVVRQEDFSDGRPAIFSDILIVREMQYWEIIAEKLSASVLSWGCSSEIDATGRALYTADAYRKDGRRFTVIADDRRTALLELEKVTGLAAVS
jgi:hypothetical protein